MRLADTFCILETAFNWFMINLNKNMPSVFLVLATDHQSGKPRNRENYNKLQEKIQRQYAHLNLNYKQQ